MIDVLPAICSGDLDDLSVTIVALINKEQLTCFRKCNLLWVRNVRGHGRRAHPGVPAIRQQTGLDRSRSGGSIAEATGPAFLVQVEPFKEVDIPKCSYRRHHQNRGIEDCQD